MVDAAGANAGNLTTGALRFGIPASGAGIASQRTSQNSLDFYTNGSKRISIANNGNVTMSNSLTLPGGSLGVGTSSASSTLDVNGAIGMGVAYLSGSGGRTVLDNSASTWVVTGSYSPLNLPDPRDCPRRFYIIVNRTNSSLSLSSISITDLSGFGGVVSIASHTSGEFVSDGSTWVQIR